MVKTGKKCFISAKSLKPPKYYIQHCTVLSTNLPTIMSDVLVHTIATFDKILAGKVCTKQNFTVKDTFDVYNHITKILIDLQKKKPPQRIRIACLFNV